MKQQRSFLPLVAGGVLGALGGALGAAWYVSSQVNPQPRRGYLDTYTFTPWELGVPYETVSLRSADGLSLSGWWMPHPAPRGVVIGCHGHSGSKDELLGIGTNTWRAGYSVLLFDFRGRGDSDPWPHTLVSREVDDLLAAVAYARGQLPEARIGVIGFSMGAAVALLATARESAIGAVVADSSFTSGADVVSHAVRRTLRFSPEILVLTADELVSRRHGYRFSQARPLDAVGQIAPRPLLIIHGEADTMIPVEHAHQLYAAAREPRQLWTVPGAEHCGAYFADRQTYCRRVVEFWDQYLSSIE